MKAQELRFTGSVPSSYQQLMVPLFFRPYAQELVLRARSHNPERIIETAAGTGAVTQALCDALPDAEIIATDLNQPMLAVAGDRIRSDRVTFITANAEDLPFDEGGFDLAVCQFGAMFFPDKVRAHAEARRVLRARGHYLLAIWDRIERNELSNAAQQALIDVFPDAPPLFMREGPFSYSDPIRIESDLHEAGFEMVEIETVDLKSRCRSAREAAEALCYGTPMRVEVEDLEPGSLDRVFTAVERALRRFEGPDGIDAQMAAHIVTASH
jgi:ubiquinone/menaquinone biosynthesis C-methylase UbiE